MTEDDLFPIPEIGLLCPQCGYSLTGLTTPRCPECGQPFDPSEVFHDAAGSRIDVRRCLLRQVFPDLDAEYDGLIEAVAGQINVTLMSGVGVILQEWFDKTTNFAASATDWRRVLEQIRQDRDPLIMLPRAPRQVLVDFPMPECGVDCPGCGASLAGATEPHCPACGQEFDADALAGDESLASLSGETSAAGFQQAELEAEGIPNVRATREHAMSIAHGSTLLNSAVVSVPRAYLYDALEFFNSLPRPLSAGSEGADGPAAADSEAAEWSCPGCGESVPSHFESCWNCGGARQP